MYKIYDKQLKMKISPFDVVKYFPKMNNEKLYKMFFFYYISYHRKYCNLDTCRAIPTLVYCDKYSKNYRELSKNLFYFINRPKLVK